MSGFQCYQDERGKRRWRFVVANGQTVATWGEPYGSKGNAKRAIEEFKRQVELSTGRRPRASSGRSG